MPATDTRTGTIITMALAATATIITLHIPPSTIIMIIKVRGTRTAIKASFPTSSL